MAIPGLLLLLAVLLEKARNGHVFYLLAENIGLGTILISIILANIHIEFLVIMFLRIILLLIEHVRRYDLPLAHLISISATVMHSVTRLHTKFRFLD